MKKILPRIALALAPLMLYFAVFAAFEPNNYFGLHKNGSTNSPISRLRAYAQNPQTAVILGDSRMAHFDMTLVNEAAGRAYANAAYGGASLEESIDEFYYLYEQNPALDKVVLGLSFYTLNSNYRTLNRMKTVKTQLENPAAYVFNLEYNINMLTALSDKLHHRPDVEETAEHSAAEYTDATGAPLPYRQNLIAYAATLYGNCAVAGALPAAQTDDAGTLRNARALADSMLALSPASSKYAVNNEALQKLLTMADFCKQNGISLTLVLPPMDASVRALVCEPLGIDTAMQPALAALAESGAQVLDYEWANDPAYTDTQYYDGFHLDTRHGLPQWTKTLFSEVA